VISPSWPAFYYLPKRVRRADEVMRQLGLRVSYGAHAALTTHNGLSSGSAQQRAQDLMDAFADPDVDVVFSAFGGDTTLELIPWLDADRLRRSPKAFVGNSDNVWLNHYLYQDVGLTSFYGATYVAEMGEAGGPFPETLEYLRRAMMSTEDLVCRPVPRRSSEFNNWSVPAQERRPRRRNVEGGWRWIRPGRGSGPLVGAELRILIAMATRFELDLTGSVLFWDVGVNNDRDLREQLHELLEIVSLDRLAGMVVGPDVRHAPQAWAAIAESALSALLSDTSYPILVNADIGHLDPKWVVPYGRHVRLDSSHGVVFPRTARPAAVPGADRDPSSSMPQPRP
jgi:muramoyltetrapeptide carboxypeptidase